MKKCGTGSGPRALKWSMDVEQSGMPADNCDTYNLCGAYGLCNIGNLPSCGCFDKFVPRDSSGKDWSNGCFRRMPLECRGDVFLKYSGINLPDSRNTNFYDQIMLLSDCEVECSKDCSCTACTQLNIRGDGSGCLFYHGDLNDIRTLSLAGQDLYIRMAAAERVVGGSKMAGGSKGRTRVILIASFTIMAGIIIVCVSLSLVLKQKKEKQQQKDQRLKQGKMIYEYLQQYQIVLVSLTHVPAISGSNAVYSELPFFNSSIILRATDNFSIVNKLGEGGFGPVYRGMLEDGQEIAVKYLSKNLITRS